MKNSAKLSSLSLWAAIVLVGCDESQSSGGNSSRANSPQTPTSSSRVSATPTQPNTDVTATSTQPSRTAAMPNSRQLTAEEAEYYRSQGYNPDDLVVQTQPQETQEPMALVYLDQFLGSANSSVAVKVSDLVSIKPDHLKFRLAGQTYDYSGHYAIMFPQARKHSGSILGFGGPDKAKFVSIHSSGLEMMMKDATVWENKGGFIDVEAMGREFICSGSFELQN